ncbi:MAG: hypothetical protein QM728_12645 [Gordonia sp. (in: high G+C Gram-positive bacteria)]|uniref:hypothetical protein n=1 Tax=Gordonia sp. (in: high G+C Gram-positive bacteria) TaxID=84139 RepID=UPI0039E42288
MAGAIALAGCQDSAAKQGRPFEIPGLQTFDEHRFSAAETSAFSRRLPDEQFFERYFPPQVDEAYRSVTMDLIKESVDSATRHGGCLAIGKARHQDGSVKPYVVGYDNPAMCPR